MIANRSYKIRVVCDRCEDRYVIGRHPGGRWDQAGVLNAMRSRGWLIQSDRKDQAPDLCPECQRDLKRKIMYEEFGGVET